MLFRFESDLPHQLAAIEAVCDLFRGQEINRTTFTVAPGEIEGQLALAETMRGYGNRLDVGDGDILANLREVQARNGLDVADEIESLDFTVEMETGTGKTYVYLRTIFELNRRYGFTKFVIVVPSVAIREGVKKSIEQMREHFRALYDGAPFASFVYDSGDLAKVKDFATAASIRTMIVTIQSINSATNVFYDGREQTQDIPAADWVAETRPILIVDEPQSVDGGPYGRGREALRKMNPLATLRYSATHVEKFHQVYRLDAFDAHDRGLVKSIEVDGARISDAASSPFVKLVGVEARRGHAPRAEIEIGVQRAGGAGRDRVWVNEDDMLADVSGGRTVYADMRIGAIDARLGGSMQLMLPGEIRTLRTGESHGDVDADSLARAMIHRTIRHHFDKEVKLRPQGIKTLSLFFVNRVADYRRYDPATGDAQPGPLARIFEEEYAKLAAGADYRDALFAGAVADPAGAHGGYFSQDKRSITPFEERTFARSTKDETVEARTFDLIMKDKERLLDEATPLRFLFSHSALREGWDNPNVFQICVLRGMGAERQRRQSIGRGLRLCVDRHGQRRRSEGLNILTVVSDEEFRTFADGLQREIEQDLGIRLGIVEEGQFAGLEYGLPDGRTVLVSAEQSRAIFASLRQAEMIDPQGRVNDSLRAALADGTVPLPAGLPEGVATIAIERLRRLARRLEVRDANRTGRIGINAAILQSREFRALWERIGGKTAYRLDFDDSALIDRCAKALAAMPRPGEARVTFETADLIVGREGVTAKRTQTATPRRLASAPLPLPDLLGELQNRTELPRKVLARMLIASGRLDEVRLNPSAFVDACALVINAGKRLAMVDGIVYRRLDDCHDAELLFRPETNVNEARMVAVSKAPLDHVVFESETVEKRLALDLEDSEAVKVFAKLPRGFRIPTPFGTYNPDWALVRETENGELIYLVVESKADFANLRDAEKVQIQCGEAHFRALGVPFVQATNLDQLLNAT